MSEVRTNRIAGLDGVERYSARSWVNFNGTGTVAIRASGNVSSIVDNGVGDHTQNFSSTLSDASYSVVAAHKGPAQVGGSPVQQITQPVGLSSSSVRLSSSNSSSAVLVDGDVVTTNIHR